ncbi:MAG: DUF2784 family protein [Alphaproteobacteria bacterium]
MTPVQLLLADIAFDIVHLGVIFFNLFGWIWPATRLAHRWLVAATVVCWLGIGAWYGTIGYCPLTDWHWQVKNARGTGTPAYSYIDYLLQMAGIHADPVYIDAGVAVVFISVVAVTVYLWWRDSGLTSPARRTAPH